MGPVGGPCLVTHAGHSMGPRTPGAHSMRPCARSRPLPPRLGGTAPRVSSSAITARGLLGLHCELCLTASHGPASRRTGVGWTHTSGCTLHKCRAQLTIASCANRAHWSCAVCNPCSCSCQLSAGPWPQEVLSVCQTGAQFPRSWAITCFSHSALLLVGSTGSH